jgi:predicted lipoprotein
MMAFSSLVLASPESDWQVRRTQDFLQAIGPLVQSLETYCSAPPDKADLAAPRQSWRQALIAWERLSAVAFGAVLERRSQRHIDFNPTRPRLIEKAVKSAPRNLAALETIGTPAKGFPALEWLLWVKPLSPASPECGYAEQLAREIQQEAQALASAPQLKDDAQAQTGELVNQWIGGLERLRWPQMEMPARVALSGSVRGAPSRPDYPRGPSGATADVWNAQWQSLRELASPSLVAASPRLPQALARAEAAMAKADPADLGRIIAIAGELATLKRLVENEVAPALGVVVGFSDADGD